MFAILSAVVTFNIALIAVAMFLMAMYLVLRFEVFFVKKMLNIIVYPMKKVFG